MSQKFFKKQDQLSSKTVLVQLNLVSNPIVFLSFVKGFQDSKGENRMVLCFWLLLES